MKKKLLSALSMLMLYFGSFAQTNIADYTFSISTAGIYTPIVGSTTLFTSWDNNVSASIPIGGNFVFGGVTYTACFVSGNGYITFGNAPGGANYTPMQTLGTTSACISGFAFDGASSTFAGSSPAISYMNVGSEFVVEFKDYAAYAGRATEMQNFQIRLNLTTNQINIIYGPVNTPASTSYVAQVGIRGNSTTWASNVSSLLVGNVPASTTCNWANAVTSNANSSGLMFNNTNTAVAPQNGLVYTWDPPVVAVSPVRVFSAVTGITTTSALVAWTAPTAATQYNVQYRVQGSCGWTNFTGNPVSITSASLTGLTPSTIYQVRVQSSDGTNNAIWSHIPNAAGTGNGYVAAGTFSTLTNACTGMPSAGTVPASFLICPNTTAIITNTSSNIGTGITYTWQQASTLAGPYTNVSTGSGFNTQVLTTASLTSQTFYQLVVTCTNSSQSATSTPVAVNIATTTINTPPYFEGFEGITLDNELPNCSWAASNLPTICKTYTTAQATYNRIPNTGSKFASFRYGTNSAGDYFYTNGIQLNAGSTYSAAAFYITDGGAGWQEFSLLYGTSQSTTGLVNIASVTAGLTNTTYNLLSGLFTVPVSGIYYIAVKGRGNSSPWYLTWDDLSITTVPTCTSASGGTLSNSSINSCNGQTVSLTSTGATTGSGIVYQWMVSSTPSGPYANVVGGSGATTPSYTTAALSTGTYYYVLQTTCTTASLTGISNEGTVTINPIPTASATANGPLCSGQTINLTGGSDVGTNFMWTGPNTYTANTQNPSINNSPASANGEYTLIVSTPNCTSTPATVTVGVNATPSALTVTPNSAAFCAGGSVTLAAAGGNIPATLAFGTQANQNNNIGATAYPSPYTAYYGGQKMQILVLASELTAAGFVTNSPLNSIQFPVVSKGANWGSSINENQNFQVNIGMTAASNLTAFQTGLTNVVAPMNFTPTVGYNNTHTFSTPFIWDGTSNVVVETTWSNNFSGGSADGVVSYNSPTPSFTSTIVYRVDSQNAATVAGATTITYNYTARPDFKFNGEALGIFNWTPSASLSSATGSTVTATPAATTIYTVSVANGSCTANANVSVSVTPIPSVSVAATSTVICSGNQATLTASGATTYSWNTAATTTAITISPSANSSYTVTGYNGTCTNTAVQSVSVNTTPTVNATSSATLICDGQSATLTASGANTYSWNTTSTNTSVAVSPTTTTSYTVTGTSNGCSNTFVISQAVSPCTGVNENVSTLGGILVYPNPNTGEFTIELNNGSVKNIDVMDLTGRVIVSNTSSNDKVDFNINTLANGIYYVRIQSNNTVEVIKVVKQ